MAEDAAAAERRKRAEARQAKIASRGADRLAKITGAAKGDDASERFGTGGQREDMWCGLISSSANTLLYSFTKTSIIFGSRRFLPI